MDVEIIHMGAADTKLLDRVAEDVFDAPLDRGRLVAYLAREGHLLVVARCDGEVIGRAAAVIHLHPDKPTELYVSELAVTPTYRRRGIARRMMERLFALGREAGCEGAWVVTEADNTEAERLYTTLRDTSSEPCVLFAYEL